MGNRLGRQRQVVDEKYTRLQGLYEHKDVDHKKLRKLILDSKLAPCYPGDEELAVDLEECPICFLYYPSLNRSKCCMKGICTECFLQIKPPHSTRQTQCPFCKTSNYGVDYRGLRSKEEKGMEQLEEQKVIEAKIRMRQQELLDEEQRILKKQEISPSSGRRTPSDAECRDITSISIAVPSLSLARQSEDIVQSEDLCVASTISRPPHLAQRREGNFDLDLEDIMVMEAIWLSIQECGTCGNVNLVNHNFALMGQRESSPSAGLACSIAALAERQHIDLSSSAAMPAFGMSETSGSMSSRHMSLGNEMEAVNYTTGNWIDVSADNERTLTTRPETEWALDHASVVAEAGTSYASSDGTLEGGGRMQSNDTVGDQLQPAVAGPILPESFDEQMMLAMAVSLAEAQSRPSPQEMTWL